MILLKATSLSHRFDYPLFKDISLELHSRESIAIVGVSGSGKSTLLHILSSLLKPNSGEVELFGHNIYTLDDKQLVQLRRHDLGLIYQSHYLFKGFSAYENLEVAAILAGETIDPVLLANLGIETGNRAKSDRTLRRPAAACLYRTDPFQKTASYFCR